MPKQAVSDRKLAANRANAKKSTGPKSVEGKAVSRLNAVTHGLTAATVVLPGEDQRAFEAERLGWIEDWKPQSQTKMALVERAVAQSWRLRRCVRAETARLTKIIQEFSVKYDNAIDDRLARGMSLLQTNPGACLDALGFDALGIDLLVSFWSELAKHVSATPTAWNDFDEHHARLMNLHGLHADADPDEIGPIGRQSLRLLRANSGDLGPDEAPVDQVEARFIMNGLLKVIDRNVQTLLSRMNSYPHHVDVRRREIDAACIDSSKVGLGLFRYEASLDRAFRATISQLMQMSKSNVDVNSQIEATAVANHCGTETCDASSVQDAPPKEPRDPRPEPSEPAEIDSDPSRTSDRDRDGRIWTVEGPDSGLTDQ